MPNNKKAKFSPLFRAFFFEWPTMQAPSNSHTVNTKYINKKITDTDAFFSFMQSYLNLNLNVVHN
jgi:hypothetical protein